MLTDFLKTFVGLLLIVLSIIASRIFEYNLLIWNSKRRVKKLYQELDSEPLESKKQLIRGRICKEVEKQYRWKNRLENIGNKFKNKPD